ncbi:PhoH-like phosphate starvation-inducible [Dinoroseobacter phage vB_DshS-R5C]|uniref:PhoH-like protein n=1 Tax=Dinoroseobacter phage vB_DshS-R5C TaxID=1965368 RepID=A0A1V0DY72_9CAUD|nr:PhoH-like phosphate starvation-inducible [Dinoroseobacter phage vB_DshS-R5C]ARB06101.1 phosphate starvation-inducible protein [Dinoroseobacter phage vB_DshS-R5C]
MGSNSMRKQRQAERNWKPPQIETLTQKQASYVAQLAKNDCVVATGPAGTGKTYVACAHAGQALFNKDIHNIVLTRPNVGVAGKTMGFLPGDAKRKMAPWARPLVEAFKHHMGAKKHEEATNQGKIKIEALEHIRGLTFDDAVMIIDEAQNTTPEEMKAFLTRIGENSQVIICGDDRQSDLHPTENGLAWVMRAIEQGLVRGIGRTKFTHADTVRSEMCRMWAEAFDALEDEDADPKAGVNRFLVAASS